MANTRFEPHFIQDSLYNTKYSNVCAEECEAFKLGFILLSSLFVYKFSSQFFKASQSSIRPLECSYKSLFNYSNNYDNDEDNEDDEDNSDEEFTVLQENNQNEITKTKDTDENIKDQENNEETIEENNEENNEKNNEENNEENNENTIEDDTDPYNYKDFFSDKEFKLVLFNYLKNKDSNENLKNLEDSNKYKEFIENLEKDTLGYVYI